MNVTTHLEVNASTSSTSTVENHKPFNHQTDSKIAYIAEAAFWTLGMFLNPIVDFFTQGLSDFLALETLRHGTSYQSYINIRITGADPEYSKKDIGATALDRAKKDYGNSNHGYFYVLKDSEAHVANTDGPVQKTGAKFLSQIAAKNSARCFCALASSNTYKGSWLLLIPRILIVILSILIVPTVKFRFVPEDIKDHFKNDPDCCGLAYITDKNISTQHIGLRGIVTQGFKGGVWKRMKAHPVKVTWGLVKLINPIGILILLGVSAAGLVKHAQGV